MKIRPFRRDNRPDPGPPVNERVLRFRDVRVVGAEGEQLGIMQSRTALQMAKELGLDLVMVAPNAQPPVCKIIDYGRYKYQTEKQKSEKKSKPQELKGIKISPRIAEHDIQTAVNKIRSFLEEGHKVKITCMFRAREISYSEIGKKKVLDIADRVKDLGSIEKAPSMEGRMMTMILLPKPGAGKPKDGKAKDAQDGGKKVQDHGVGEDHPAPDAQ